MHGTDKQNLSDALNIKQSLSEGLRTFLSNILDIISCLNDDDPLWQSGKWQSAIKERVMFNEVSMKF